jgi:hypothetical protein
MAKRLRENEELKSRTSEPLPPDIAIHLNSAKAFVTPAVFLLESSITLALRNNRECAFPWNQSEVTGRLEQQVFLFRPIPKEGDSLHSHPIAVE